MQARLPGIALPGGSRIAERHWLVLDRSRSSVLTVGCWWQCGLVSHTTLVIGVSRRQGIGFAIARRLLREDGARVFAHSFVPCDATEPWGPRRP